MTVHELIEELRPFNKETEVRICCDGDDMFISELELSDEGVILIHS